MSVRNGQQMSYLVNDIYTRILHRRTVGPFGMVSLCDGLDGLHICTCPLPTSGRPPLLPTTLIKISVLSPPPDRQQLVSELPNKNLNIISIWHKFNKITISNQFLKVCKYTYMYVLIFWCLSIVGWKKWGAFMGVFGRLSESLRVGSWLEQPYHLCKILFKWPNILIDQNQSVHRSFQQMIQFYQFLVV